MCRQSKNRNEQIHKKRTNTYTFELCSSASLTIKPECFRACAIILLNGRKSGYLLSSLTCSLLFSAVLFYTKKIRPEPFLVSSVLWLFLMVSFWYFLPYTIYKRSATFKDSFTIFFFERQIRLKNTRGFVEWSWTDFNYFF